MYQTNVSEKKKKDRSKHYWLPRLERDHPDIHRRLHSGDIKTVRQARILAGLLRQPDSIDSLKRLWTKLSPTDRGRFQRWIAGGAAGKYPPASLVEPDGRLTPAVIARVRSIMARTKMKPGQFAMALGLKSLNPNVPNALNRGWKPDADFLERLSAWLENS